MKKNRFIFLIIAITLMLGLFGFAFFNKLLGKSKKKELPKLEIKQNPEFDYSIKLADVKGDEYVIKNLQLEDLNVGTRVYFTIANTQTTRLSIKKLIIKLYDKFDEELSSFPVYDINLTSKEERLIMVDTERNIRNSVRYDVSVDFYES